MRILGFTDHGGPEVLRWLDVPDPEPAAGQVLVRTEAVGVNPADIKVREGARRGKVEVRFPMAVGREAAGTVVAVGEGVDLPVGQPVFGATASGTGALGELVLLDASATTVVPDEVPFEAVACIPVSVGTALDVLDAWSLPPGSPVLVVGAGGGVGTALTQLARARGLDPIGVASPGKQDLVRQCGAEPVESGPGWACRVRPSVPGGVAAVLDCVGDAVLDDALGLLAADGTLTSLAAPARAAELTGGRGGGVERRRTSAVFAEAATLVADGRLVPVVTTYAWEQALDAVARVETGHAAGNVVVLGPPAPMSS